MVKDFELRELLERAAKDMHAFSPSPSTWLSWITFFLSELENQSRDVNPSNHERYLEMVSNLQDAIYNRQQTGSW